MGASHSLAGAPHYSQELKGTEDVEGGKGAIRRHPDYPELIETYEYKEGPQVRTLYENFQRGVAINGDGPCMGHRPIDAEGNPGPYEFFTYNEIQERINRFGSGVLNLGLAPPDEERNGMRRLGHYSVNRMEWVISEQACNAYSAVVVPLYDSLGPDAVSYVINQAELKTVVCSHSKVYILLEAKPNCPTLDTIVQMEDVVSEERRAKLLDEFGITLLSFAEVEEAGAANPQDHIPPAPEDIATFCYTSGTTGDPKGAMLTHGNCIADLAAAQYLGVEVTTSDVHISYLPLAHMFERIVQAAGWGGGASLGFYQGDTLKLMSDIAALRPTIFPSVPRLFNKIYDKILGGVTAAGGIKAALFHRALDAKVYWLKRGHYDYPMWDKLVFMPLRTRLGLDRCRLMITGSAPIAGHVLDFLRAGFGCPVLEGYGQTEGAAACTLTRVDDVSVGHVGGPIPCCEIRLESVPDMNYLVTDTLHGADEASGNEGIPCGGRGEIVYRGANIFAGYFRNPEKTAEAIDGDGWLHSGDIGMWTAAGAIKIIDRKKNIFKLSQGEYVAAEKIENVYLKSPFIAQMFVYGNSLQSSLVGIVVPDQDYVKVWAENPNMDNGAFDEMCEMNANLKAAILEDMARVAAEEKLRGFEKVRKIHVTPDLFSVENDLLTPTFKLKRKQAQDHFQGQIDAMYATEAVAGQTGLKQDQ